MGHWATPALVSFWILNFSSIILAGLHRLSYLELITPQAASGLPKRLNILRVDDLLLSVYDSNIGTQVPRNGYNQNRQHFWRQRFPLCLAWDSWVETTYQALVREVNASAPQAEPYYMQVLKSCELDDATGAIRAITKYSLNGEDVLQYQSDQNRWFSVHPAAWFLAERWNRARETFSDLSLQQCMFLIEDSGLLITEKTAQPTAHVALVPGTQAQPRRLVCHVTGFYPRDIEIPIPRAWLVSPGSQLAASSLPWEPGLLAYSCGGGQGPGRGRIAQHGHSQGPTTVLQPRLVPPPQQLHPLKTKSDQPLSWACWANQGPLTLLWPQLIPQLLDLLDQRALSDQAQRWLCRSTALSWRHMDHP